MYSSNPGDIVTTKSLPCRSRIGAIFPSKAATSAPGDGSQRSERLLSAKGTRAADVSPEGCATNRVMLRMLGWKAGNGAGTEVTFTSSGVDCALPSLVGLIRHGVG